MIPGEIANARRAACPEAPVTRRSTIAISRTLRPRIAVLLFAAGLCGAQVPDSTKVMRSAAADHVDSLFHGHGFDGTGGIHAGSPAVLSAAIGTKYWLGDALPGAVFTTLEPGVLAFRYGIGYQLYDERLYGAGAALRLVRLTGWRDALGVARGAQYSGGELALSWAFALCARAGTYVGRRKDGRSIRLGTVDIGFGF
jgi:hypothetical protein